MEIVKTRSFARAGFLGNPSDGYFGKTVSFAFSNFGVELALTESARLRFVPGEVDDATFDSPEQLVRDLRAIPMLEPCHMGGHELSGHLVHDWSSLFLGLPCGHPTGRLGQKLAPLARSPIKRGYPHWEVATHQWG